MRTDWTGIAYLAALAVGAVVVWRIASGGRETVQAVGRAVDAAGGAVKRAVGAVAGAPSSAADAAVQAATGDGSTSLGSWVYDWANPSDPAGPAAVAPTPGPGASAPYAREDWTAADWDDYYDGVYMRANATNVAFAEAVSR